VKLGASGLRQPEEKCLCCRLFKMSRCKAPEAPRNEAYREVRRNDEERG
jgi:hypothetical protein